MIGDPFLSYFALFMLFFVVIVMFYGIIAIHDIPHLIAKARSHPHQDAIYAAGWVSIFTLHALWPFLWIWAMAYQPERGWGFGTANSGRAGQPNELASELAELRGRIADLERKALLETRAGPESKASLESAGPESKASLESRPGLENQTGTDTKPNLEGVTGIGGR